MDLDELLDLTSNETASEATSTENIKLSASQSVPDSHEDFRGSTKQNIENYAKRLLNLEQQKKIIQEDIKALKLEFKEEGVPVGVVSRVINQLKREKKQTEGELHEEIVIKDWLSSNTEIDDEIGALVAKV